MDNNLKAQENQGKVPSYQTPHPVHEEVYGKQPTKTFYTVIFSLIIVFVTLVGLYLIFLIGSQLTRPQTTQTSAREKRVKPPITAVPTKKAAAKTATPTPAIEEERELQNMELDDFETDFLDLQNDLNQL